MNLSKDYPLIEMKGICKRFGNVDALMDVDFQINKNEIIGLVGDNGAGKSTLINILSGYYQATKGKIFCSGKEVKIKSHIDSINIGVDTIYQKAALVDQMSIYRNIFLGREILNRFGIMNEKMMSEKTMELLNNIGISGIKSANSIVGDLSGGQKQSVAIARAVNFKNKVLLLDEPTNSLSVKETHFVVDYIKELKKGGISSVLVTHSLNIAYKIADRFVILGHGKKIADLKMKDSTLKKITDIIMLS